MNVCLTPRRARLNRVARAVIRALNYSSCGFGWAYANPAYLKKSKPTLPQEES